MPGPRPRFAPDTSRPLTANEALPFTPAATMFPFLPEIIPTPSINTSIGVPLTNLGFSTEDFDRLNRENENKGDEDELSPEAQRMIDQVLSALDATGLPDIHFNAIPYFAPSDLDPNNLPSLLDALSPVTRAILERVTSRIEASTDFRCKSASATYPAPPVDPTPGFLDHHRPVKVQPKTYRYIPPGRRRRRERERERTLPRRSASVDPEDSSCAAARREEEEEQEEESHRRRARRSASVDPEVPPVVTIGLGRGKNGAGPASDKGQETSSTRNLNAGNVSVSASASRRTPFVNPESWSFTFRSFHQTARSPSPAGSDSDSDEESESASTNRPLPPAFATRAGGGGEEAGDIDQETIKEMVDNAVRMSRAMSHPLPAARDTRDRDGSEETLGRTAPPHHHRAPSVQSVEGEGEGRHEAMVRDEHRYDHRYFAPMPSVEEMEAGARRASEETLREHGRRSSGLRSVEGEAGDGEDFRSETLDWSEYFTPPEDRVPSQTPGL